MSSLVVRLLAPLGLCLVSLGPALAQGNVKALASWVQDRGLEREVRSTAIHALAALGPEAAAALPALLEVYDEDDPELAEQVDEALHTIGVGDGSAFLAVIRRGAPDEHIGFKGRLVYGLSRAELGPRALLAAPALIEVFDCPYSHDTGDYVCDALAGLVDIGPSVKPQLYGVLNGDPRPYVRGWVSRALGELGPPEEVLPVLQGRLELAVEEAGRAYEESRDCGNLRFELLFEAGQAIEAISDLLEDEPVASLVAALGGTLEHPNATGRAQAAWAVAARFDEDPERLAPLLIRALGDEDMFVRSSVVEAVGSDAGHALLFSAWVGAVDDPEDWVRKNLEQTLRRLGKRWKSKGTVRAWVVPWAYRKRLGLLALGLLSWFGLVAWTRRRNPTLRRRWVVAVVAAVVSGAPAAWIVHETLSRPWTEGFQPDLPGVVVSFPTAAALTVALCCALASTLAARPVSWVVSPP